MNQITILDRADHVLQVAVRCRPAKQGFKKRIFIIKRPSLLMEKYRTSRIPFSRQKEAHSCRAYSNAWGNGVFFEKTPSIQITT